MTEFLLKFTPNDLAVLDRALQELPFRLAAPLLNKINSQIQEQQVPLEKEE